MLLEKATASVYETRARAWFECRKPPSSTKSFGRYLDAEFARETPAPATEPTPVRRPVVADLGCGPGWSLEAIAGGDRAPGEHPHALGRVAVGLDISRAMLGIAANEFPGHPLVRGRIEQLPFRRGALDAVYASKSLLHVDRRLVPMVLRRLHALLSPDGVAFVSVTDGDHDLLVHNEGGFGGRAFSGWPEQLFDDVLALAGFEVLEGGESPTSEGRGVFLDRTLRRTDTLPQTVGPNLELLIVGVNPSPTSALQGVGFAHAGNRFWPGLLAAGVAGVDRDPEALLSEYSIGMTDLSKRVTARADELSRSELVGGYERLERLVTWLGPKRVAVLGVTAWRQALGRPRVSLGLQGDSIGGAPLWVLPNPSGLNAHTSIGDMAEWFAAVLDDRDHRS